MRACWHQGLVTLFRVWAVPVIQSLKMEHIPPLQGGRSHRAAPSWHDVLTQVPREQQEIHYSEMS